MNGNTYLPFISLKVNKYISLYISTYAHIMYTSNF